MRRAGNIPGPNGRTRPKKLYDDSDDENLDLKIDSITEKIKTPTFVYILSCFSALGGFLFGYDTGVISGAMLLLRNEFGLLSFWQELLISVTPGAAALFALVGGCMSNRLGRRLVIMLASLVFTVGAIFMAAAVDKYMLLAGRVIVGAAIGLASTTVPVYLAECSPLHIRGRLVSLNIAFVAGGQLVASVVDGIFGSYEQTGWRYMLGLSSIPSFIQFVGFIFLPESPRWLIISEQEEKARRVLQSLRGQLDIEEEYQAIKTNCHSVGQGGSVSSSMPVFFEMFKVPCIRKALFIGCVLQVVQQVSGINSVMYYSATIIRMSGVRSDEAAIWLAALTALVNFMFTLLGLYLVEKIGRRPLTLGSLFGAIISLTLLAVGFHMSSLNTPHVSLPAKPQANSSCWSHSTCNDCMSDLRCGFCFMDGGELGVGNSSCLPADYNNPWVATAGRCSSPRPGGALTWAYDYCPTPYSWMPMIGLILYIVTFAPGMGPMPWTVNSEIYPLWARGSATSLATCCNWVANVAMSLSFLTLTECLSRFGTFLLYAGLALIGALVLFLWLPETKGKTLEEMEGIFAGPWCGVHSGVDYNTKTIQYVHIRGLNRDGRESELDSPE